MANKFAHFLSFVSFVSSLACIFGVGGAENALGGDNINAVVDSAWWYCRSAMAAPVASAGMFGLGPGLTGRTDAILDNLA